MSAQLTAKTVLFKEIMLLLGSQMVDVELDPEHVDLSIKMGIQKLRQQSDGALLEKDIFLHLTPNTTEYTLPEEVPEVNVLPPDTLNDAIVVTVDAAVMLIRVFNAPPFDWV